MPEDRIEALFRNLRLAGSVDGRIPPGAKAFFRNGLLAVSVHAPNPDGALVELFFSGENRAGGIEILGNINSTPTGNSSIKPILRAAPIPQIKDVTEGSLPELPPLLTEAESLFNYVSGLKNLPALPAVVARALEMSMDETKTAADLAEVISRDLVLSAEILRLANSAYYGRRQRVETVHRAVVVLGFNRVRAALLTISVLRMLPENEASRKPLVPVFLSEHSLWQHSLATAIATSALAETLGTFAPENAFVTGLFHDLGKMILDLYLSPIMARSLLLAERGGTLLRDAEIRLTGLSHERIGEWLASSWGLPSFICSGIEKHHLPELAPEGDPAPGLVHAGDILAGIFMIGWSGNRRIPQPHPTTIRKMGLNSELLEQAVRRFIRGLSRSTVFFGLLGEGASPETVSLLLQARKDPGRYAELAGLMEHRLGDTDDPGVKAFLEVSKLTLMKLAEEGREEDR